MESGFQSQEEQIRQLQKSLDLTEEAIQDLRAKGDSRATIEKLERRRDALKQALNCLAGPSASRHYRSIW